MIPFNLASTPAALAWAGAHPAGEQRDQLLARMAFVQSQTAPVDAARLKLAGMANARNETGAP